MVALITKPRCSLPGGTEPKARVTDVANWHDGLGCVIASADYGTNGGTTLAGYGDSDHDFHVASSGRRVPYPATAFDCHYDPTRLRPPVSRLSLESTGPAWVTPAYDPAGNMTTIPKPADPTQGFSAVYDAWNRLVKLSDVSGTVQENEYDGRNFRVVRKDHSGGVLTETRHFYYTSAWQVLEERGDSSTSPNRQFVWALRYIDDLVLRERDTSGDGVLDERLYALQDGNWNVTAVCDANGDVQERYAYTAYGEPLFLSPGFVEQSGSSFGWEVLYGGDRWDDGTWLSEARHRHLMAELGCWLSRDPDGYQYPSFNLYEYTGGYPLGRLDPEGTDWLDCMAECIEDNDPLTLALKAAVGALALSGGLAFQNCVGKSRPSNG